ncbi:hypothetical protein [uncultured Psychrobacter sp.]|uniref:hypothetical protein n=1 Tax=uncultured Psychrobacter sp. TaxID=259303 RepID=UPI0030D8EB40
MSDVAKANDKLVIKDVSDYLKYLNNEIKIEPQVSFDSKTLAEAINGEYRGIRNPIFEGSEYNNLIGLDENSYNKRHRDVVDFYNENYLQLAAAAREIVNTEHYGSWAVFLAILASKSNLYRNSRINQYFNPHADLSEENLHLIISKSASIQIQLMRLIIAELLKHIATSVNHPYHS